MPSAGGWTLPTSRRAVGIAGAAALVVLGLAFAFAIAGAQVRLLLALSAVALSPLVLYAAWRWPYVVPYAVYLLLVPFEDVLVIPGAGTLTRFLALAAVLFVSLYALRQRRIATPSLSLYCFLAFFVWLALDLTRTPDFQEASRTTMTFGLLILMYAVMSLAPINESQLRLTCGAIVLGGVLASAYGIAMFHQHPELLATSDGRVTIGVNGHALDPNGFADSLLAPFAFSLIALLHARRPLALFATLAATALVFGAIVASMSREALIAAVLIIAVTIWFSRHRVKGFVAGALALGAVPLVFPAIVARMAAGFGDGGAGRTSIWRVDILAFLAHPIVGWGTGGSIEAYDRNYLRVFQFYDAGWSRPPHNTALFLAVEFGVIGVLLFFGGWFAVFRPLRAVRRGDSLYDLRVGLTGSLVALLVAGCFVDVSAFRDFWAVLVVAAQFRTVVLMRPRVPAAPIVYEPAVPASAGARSAAASFRRPMVRNGTSR